MKQMFIVTGCITQNEAGKSNLPGFFRYIGFEPWNPPRLPKREE